MAKNDNFCYPLPMKSDSTEVVTASEIASWAWCPESWRLEALGAEQGNRTAIRRGDSFHSRLGFAERLTAFATTLGWWLLAAGLLLALLAIVLAVRG